MFKTCRSIHNICDELDDDVSSEKK